MFLEGKERKGKQSLMIRVINYTSMFGAFGVVRVIKQAYPTNKEKLLCILIPFEQHDIFDAFLFQEPPHLTADYYSYGTPTL